MMETTEHKCCCGVVLGTTPEDDEGEMNILYQRCPVHEVHCDGSWFADEARDLHGYGLTKEGKKFIRELEQNRNEEATHA